MITTAISIFNDIMSETGSRDCKFKHQQEQAQKLSPLVYSDSAPNSKNMISLDSLHPANWISNHGQYIKCQMCLGAGFGRCKWCAQASEEYVPEARLLIENWLEDVYTNKPTNCLIPRTETLPMEREFARGDREYSIQPSVRYSSDLVEPRLARQYDTDFPEHFGNELEPSDSCSNTDLNPLYDPNDYQIYTELTRECALNERIPESTLREEDIICIWINPELKAAGANTQLQALPAYEGPLILDDADKEISSSDDRSLDSSSVFSVASTISSSMDIIASWENPERSQRPTPIRYIHSRGIV